MKSNICIFTIVSNNYLHYANTLFESVKEFCPEADLVLGLCDRKSEETSCPGAEILALEDLEIPSLGRFIYQYTILELNTAIKPYIMEMLMDRGYDKVIYFDPDIKLFNSLKPMMDLLDDYNVLLTPHLTNLLDDGKLPNELGILQAGSYNLGYIGLANSDESKKLLKWWQRKLYKECVVDLSRGLFVDQKWMDMVPSLFDGVFICRNEGWNVAYWNLNHRDIERSDDGTFKVNGEKLVFFHYSGYSIKAKTLSKHQNRFEKTSKGSELVKLCQIYDECLLRNGIEKFKSIPYAFNSFADGVPVPAAARLIIKDHDYFEKIDFFEAQEADKIHDYLNELIPSSKKAPVNITRLALQLWRTRDDLQQAFPDPCERDAVRFADWLLHAAEKEANFSPVYLQKIAESMKCIQAQGQDATQDSELQTNARINFSTRIIRKVWENRELIPLPIRLKLGESVASWAFKNAYKMPDVRLESGMGLNVIGYVNAESGVGEAARASIRALQSSHVPFAVIDYRVGNVSRMQETIETETTELGKFAVNLIHVNADQSKVVREHMPQALFESHYNIGYWYWEMPEFPEFLDFAFEQVDEVWVATKYVQSAIQAKTNKPVKLIPPNVDIKVDKAITRSDFNLDENDFVFFHMSDVLSMPERKNPIAVIEAFNQAFSSEPDMKVKLVLKLSNLEHQPELEAMVKEAAAVEPRIHLIFGYLDRRDLNGLLSNIDCYVSLHRAEGFGLPIAEAMALGKVVIGTLWSGNADFMDHTNSLPVGYELVTLEKDIGPYKKGQYWADPCIRDAADKMYHLCHNRELQSELGAAAKRTIETQYCPEATGRKIKQRLDEISEFVQ